MSSHARNKVFTVVLGATRIPLKVFLPCEPSEFIESLWYSLPTELTLEAFRMRVTLSDEGGSRIAPTPRSIPDGFTIIVGLSRGDAASAAPHPTAPTSGVKRGREQGGQLHVLDGTADRAALADDGSPSSQHPEGSRFVAAPPQEAVAAAAAADADAAAVTAPAAPAAEPLLMFKPILRGVIIPLNGGGPQKHTWAGDWSMSTDDELRSPFKYTLDLSERYKVPPHMPGTVPANPLLPSNVSHQTLEIPATGYFLSRDKWPDVKSTKYTEDFLQIRVGGPVPAGAPQLLAMDGSALPHKACTGLGGGGTNLYGPFAFVGAYHPPTGTAWAWKVYDPLPAAAPKSKAPRTLPVEASAASSLFDSRAVHNSRFDLKQRSSISHLDAQVAPGSAAPAATLLSFDVLASSVSDKSLAMAAPLHAVAGAAAVAAAVSAQPPVIINLITDAPVSYQATDVPRWDATAVMRRAFDFSYNDRVASTLTSRVASDRSHARYPFLVSLEPFEGDTVSSFTVKFSVDNTFALLGVVDAYERTLNNSECYLHDFCRFPLLYSTATHPDDGWNLITIDMTRREFRVKRLSSGEVVVRSGLPERVWFAAVFKAEYECMITLAGALDGHASTE